MLPTRIWELSIGGLSGLVKIQNAKNLKLHKFLPILGILLIVVSYLLGKKSLWVLPVMGSSLVILFCSANDITGKILSTKPFVFIGKISYSLYLWHWGIIVLSNNLKYQLQNFNVHLINGLIISLTFFLAFLSYTFIENKTRNYQHTPKIVIAGIASITCLTFYIQSDLYKPFYNTQYNQQINYVKFYDVSPSLNGLNDFLRDNSLGYNSVFPDRLQKFNDAYKNQGIISNEKYGAPKIMLIGDSHGVMWAKLLNEITDELGVTLSFYTSNGSEPFFNIDNLSSQNGNAYYTQIQ